MFSSTALPRRSARQMHGVAIATPDSSSPIEGACIGVNDATATCIIHELSSCIVVLSLSRRLYYLCVPISLRNNCTPLDTTIATPHRIPHPAFLHVRPHVPHAPPHSSTCPRPAIESTSANPCAVTTAGGGESHTAIVGIRGDHGEDESHMTRTRNLRDASRAQTPSVSGDDESRRQTKRHTRYTTAKADVEQDTVPQTRQETYCPSRRLL